MNSEEKKESTGTPSKKKYRVLKIIGRIFLIISLIIFLLLLFIRSEWGQNIIVDKATSYVSDKTNTRVEIDRLFISFDGNLVVEDLFLDTPAGDTLIYSKYIEADVPLWSIINGEAIGVESFTSEDLTARITRKDTIEGFNFQFLIDAFAAPKTEPSPTPTNSKPLKIIIGDINLQRADVVYNDAVTGINSSYVVGNLTLGMENTDIDLMEFSAYEGIIENAEIHITQNPVPKDPNAEEIPLPKFQVDALSIKNTKGTLAIPESGLDVKFNVPSFYAEVPLADLSSNTFDLKTVTFKNGKVGVDMKTMEKLSSTSSSSLWPPYNVNVDDISIEKAIINYSIDGTSPEDGSFNPNALFLRNLDLQAENLYIKDRSMGVRIEKLNGIESSGLNLKKLTGDYKMTDSFIQGESLSLRLNENAVDGYFKLDYSSLQNFINNPDDTRAVLNFPKFSLDINEVFRFQPDLRNNKYLATVSQFPVNGNLSASGTLSSLNIDKFNARWANSRVSTSGTLTNTTKPDSIGYNLPKFIVTSQRSDIIKFVDEQNLSVSIPQNVSLEGSLRGTTTAISTNTILTTTQGKATLEGTFKTEDPITFDTNLSITEYNLGALLQNDKIGSLSGTLKTQGSGQSVNTLDAKLDAQIDYFSYNGYKVKNLPLDGSIENGKGTLNSKYKDDAINLVLDSKIKLDSVAPEVRANLNIIGADLQKLGLMQRDIRTGMEIDAFFKGNATSYNATADIKDGVVVYNNDSYLIGSLKTRARVRPDTTAVEIENKMLDIKLESNADPGRFANSIQDHIYSYFYRDAVIPDTIAKPVILKLRGKISQAPLINEVFLVNVKDLDTINVNVDFNQTKRKLNASIFAPHINYSGNELDSLAFTINTDRENFNFDLGFNAINAGPISISNTKIEGRQRDNALALHFKATDDEDILIDLAASITGNRERLVYHIDHEKIIINKHEWQTPSSNEAILTENQLDFNDFRFRRNNQEINFSNNLPNATKEHIGIEFKNFRLEEFLTYFNPETTLAKGKLSGDFIMQEPFEDIGLLADLAVTNFEVVDVNMGTLNLNANAITGDNYDFNLVIAGGAVDLDLTGDYLADVEGATIDMDLNINKFEMEALQGFSQGEITEGSGTFKGRFSIDGKIAEPKYGGNLQFSNASFTIDRYNTALTLPQETVDINNNGLTMTNFTILDANENEMVVDGKVGTKNFLNPTFNLEVKADNFLALDATEEDNDLVYGKAIVNANAKITGDLNIPNVDVNATVTSGTDVVYVMPASTANIESREGIVIFVNRENPDAILTQNDEESVTLTGYNIDALLKVESGAQVKIIIDPQTGDNVRVQGNGDFDFGLTPNGRMTLSGAYEMSDGTYEMNLYNLINRTFDIAKGSRISWYGDPFDAKLDIKAIYKLETSAAPLMSPVSSSLDPTVKGRFRQVLPFFVYLNVDGELTAPKLSFGLDMPEDSQGAIGGQVFGRVQQVNNQQGELNRQVFSLLVLNSFYPDPGSDGSAGGVANIARDNLNDALSDQLNVFSDKILGNSGFEVDFGLDSYTDYQGETPQERTQLGIAAQKKLFDERLTVRVGSSIDVQGESQNGESTPVIGNVSLEYELTEDGHYRIKGFRRSEFENVIDGQIIVSGIGLLFTQEFNKFSQLWDAILRKKQEELIEEQKKKKEKEPSDKSDKSEEKIK